MILEFGDFRVSMEAKIHHSPYNENEFFVVIPRIDLPCELKVGRVEYEEYVYDEVVIKMVNYFDECMEICFGYKTVKLTEA